MIARRAMVVLVSLTVVLLGQDEDSKLRAQESEVRRVILGFVGARNAHAGARAAAAYFADGEYIDAAGNAVKGRSALAKLWGGAGEVPRAITDVKMVTSNIAIATIEAHFAVGLRNIVGKETLLLIKDDGEWRIRVHQRLN